MKGTRPLNNNEILLVSACFDGNRFEIRNRGLFMLSVSTGGRISDRYVCHPPTFVGDKSTGDLEILSM